MLKRTVNVLTANLGRGVSWAEFRANVDKIVREVSATHQFYQFQEIGEADFEGRRELDYIKKKLGDTHRFAGLQTHVPIAIPRTFTVSSRNVEVASEGVEGLSPRRHVVQACVYPVGHPKAKVIANNTHFARDTPALAHARERADGVLRRCLAVETASWLTADINSRRYTTLSVNEKRLVDARLDFIRAYERPRVSFELLKTGSVDLSIDGHNAHWARVKITWL